MSLAVAGCLTAHAAIYTYELSSFSSIQGGADLIGNITVNTAGGTENPGGSGDFYLSHNAIIAWNFTVTLSGGGSSYDGSSNGINALASGNGGSFAFFATPTTLSVVEAGSLLLESDFPLAGLTQQLEWNHLSQSAGQYAATSGSGNATWLEADKPSLDATFSSYPIPAPSGTVDNWVIATAVPEPGTWSLAGVGALVLLLRRPSRKR